MSAIGSELGERISPSSDFEVKISSRMICEDRGQAGQDQFTPRDRSDSAVCRSEVGKQLGRKALDLHDKGLSRKTGEEQPVILNALVALQCLDLGTPALF